jgi:trehalose utilization protein
MTNVLVWNEHIHERSNPAVAEIYPDGIHVALAEALTELLPDVFVATGTLADPEHGLSDEALDASDVIVWWGHTAHHDVPDDRAAAVRDRVLAGTGLVVLHSAHYSKPFRLLMGSSCNLRWREGDDKHLMWAVATGHPITAGVPSPLDIGPDEMYSEPFDVPQPDELVFISSFTGGEVFRSGCCYRRGAGRIFYFSPGHETFPLYHQDGIRRVIANAVSWVAPIAESAQALDECPWSPAGWYQET